MQVDIELLKACAKNKRRAQEELYKTCFMFLMPLCKRYHNNDEDARALYNEAFIKILNGLKNVNIDEIPFIPWAKRITTNTLIDEYRKNKKYKERISKENEERKLEYFSEGVKNHAETEYNASRIMRLLDFLKPDSKKVFVLYVIEGYSHKEIAEIMEMSEGTSKWHLSTARKELREMIIKQQNSLDNLAI